MSIPKIIHYCWFGRNPKPPLAEKCIASWQTYCPDYQIIEWNEDNFDISQAPLYVRQAYEAKKWAFVTDYVRLQIVYENGGIYMDTDVELVAGIDSFLGYTAYFGFEEGNNVATGLGFGATKGHPVLKRMMEDYDTIPFILEDGTYDSTPCPQRNTEALCEIGLNKDGLKQVLNNDILILSSEYLCPIVYSTGEQNITKQTVSIHWFDGSWQDEEKKQAHRRMQKWIRVFGKALGERLFGITECIHSEGFVSYIKNRVFCRR